MNVSLYRGLRHNCNRYSIGNGYRLGSLRSLATNRPLKPTPSFLKSLTNQWTKLNTDPKLRRRTGAGLIIFYLVTAYFGIRYLKDTKFKATGESSPYKGPYDAQEDDDESFVGIPQARDTTEIYEQLAVEYDKKIRFEELLSYIWLKRRKVMKQVKGDALEVACGTGRNIKYFKPKDVNSITFLDTSTGMLEISRKKFEYKFPEYKNVQYVKGKAEDLEKLTSSSGQKFDTIYQTFGLCSQQDPVAALQNFGKLLKPDGRIILLEHGRSANESINNKMDSIALRRAKEWGCRWNLHIDDIVNKSGLEIVESDRYHFGTTYYYILKTKP